MRKAIFLFAAFCLLAGTVNAQQIRSSPLEGRWVWDGKGEKDITEMVFFGNVLLGLYDDLPVYAGETFTFTNTIISLGEFEEWQYRISGNTLTLTIVDRAVSFKKAQIGKSPLDGIWKVTGGEGYDADSNNFVLFTGDIWAMGSSGDYEGMKVDFGLNSFCLTRSFFEYTTGEKITDEAFREYVKEMTIEYKLSGRSLTLSNDGKEIFLAKVY